MDTRFLGVPDMDALIYFSLSPASFCTAPFGMTTGAFSSACRSMFSELF